jgi:hypothetical protein
MQANAYRGEVAVEIGGATRILRYDWAAIAEMKVIVGGDVVTPLAQALRDLDLGVSCKALAIGLRAGWPEVTVERLMELSPPIVPTMQAVELAIFHAFHGARTLEEVAALSRLNPLRRVARMIERISSWRPWRALTSSV